MEKDSPLFVWFWAQDEELGLEVIWDKHPTDWYFDKAPIGDEGSG